MSLITALTTAVLPILAVSAVGYVFGAVVDVDVEPLNTVTLYLLLPALVFHSLATTSLPASTFVRIGAGVTAFILLMAGLAELIARALGEREPYLSGAVLASTFPNSGNVGIPLSEFAFGVVGRTAAVVYLTAQIPLVYTVGVYVASRSGGRTGATAVKEVFRLPLLYAALAALIVRWLGVLPPADGALLSTVQLVGNASIPLMLLVLGIQLAGTEVGALSRSLVPSALKLGLAPVVGVGIALVLGFSDPTVARVFILECATPAAITPLMLIIEYAPDATVTPGGPTAAEYVSTIILVTTVASIAVLPVVITVLDAGIGV